MPRRGTIAGVYLVMLLAAAAILGGVVAVAMGHGGELALFRRDLPEVKFRLRTPADVATLRLPIALLGYQEHATGDALRSVAWMLHERDAEIARLRDEVRALTSSTQPSASQASERAELAEPIEPAGQPAPVEPAGQAGSAEQA